MTEKEKMLAGETYSTVDPQLLEELSATREIIHDYNCLRPSDLSFNIIKGGYYETFCVFFSRSFVGVPDGCRYKK